MECGILRGCLLAGLLGAGAVSTETYLRRQELPILEALQRIWRNSMVGVLSQGWKISAGVEVLAWGPRISRNS